MGTESCGITSVELIEWGCYIVTVTFFAAIGMVSAFIIMSKVWDFIDGGKKTKR